jgi:hypothetical protein
VFTARYALGPYIKQIRFVFKGVIAKTRSGENPFGGSPVVAYEWTGERTNLTRRSPQGCKHFQNNPSVFAFITCIILWASFANRHLKNYCPE